MESFDIFMIIVMCDFLFNDSINILQYDFPDFVYRYRSYSDLLLFTASRLSSLRTSHYKFWYMPVRALFLYLILSILFPFSLLPFTVHIPSFLSSYSSLYLSSSKSSLFLPDCYSSNSISVFSHILVSSSLSLSKKYAHSHTYTHRIIYCFLCSFFFPFFFSFSLVEMSYLRSSNRDDV